MLLTKNVELLGCKNYNRIKPILLMIVHIVAQYEKRPFNSINMGVISMQKLKLNKSNIINALEWQFYSVTNVF